MKKILLLLLLSYSGFCQIGKQATADCDPLVKRELDAINIKYSISSGGNFRIIHNLENNRTQTVIINSKKYDFDGIEVREVWALSRKYSSKSDINETDSYMLLSKNSTYKFGAWQMDKDNDGTYFLIFSVRVASQANGSILKDIMGVVASRADEMEKELTKKDDY